jgi:hypothetical protein
MCSTKKRGATVNPMAVCFFNSAFLLFNSWKLREQFKNSHNLTTSYIKKKALKGENPNLSVDYSGVELSHGTLSGATELKIEKRESGYRHDFALSSLEKISYFRH